MKAVVGMHAAMVRALLGHGADALIRDDENLTSLHRYYIGVCVMKADDDVTVPLSWAELM